MADERVRIAGELHDVVAHALSAMTVQATGARRLVLTRPESAREAFAAIETSGREALGELRRLLDVLGRENAELHDHVAHSIGEMVVQAEGARRIIATDPARALEAATRIERAGRAALGEMRHLLGMLGAPGEPPALAPQPTLHAVGELVARARAAGLPATLVVHGEPRALPPGLDVAAYRIVQEAIRHAPGAATTVAVAWSESELALEVRDAGRGSTASALVGMRERVRLYGGELEAGPVDGGWRVRARLPLQLRELIAS